MRGQIQSGQDVGSPLAIVVLGCRVHAGSPGPALTRRLLQARAARQQLPDLAVIMSGGRAWDGAREADVMAAWWRRHQHDDPKLLLERESQTTRQNALRVGQLCREMGYGHVVLVTCDFHMARARRLFESEGLIVSVSPAIKSRSWAERAKLRLREWGAYELGRWESMFK